MKTTEEIAADCGLSEVDADTLKWLLENGPRIAVNREEHRILDIALALCLRIQELEREKESARVVIEELCRDGQRALDGDSNDAEHDALFEFVFTLARKEG